MISKKILINTKMKKYFLDKKHRLALTINTNSIGFAVLDLNKDGQPFRIMDAGVRVFPDGRNAKDQKPLSAIRSEFRRLRKTNKKFKNKKSRLRSFLEKLNLISSNKLETSNPYELRMRALDEKLSKDELVRVLFHLTQRRGFKSSRKDLSKINEDEIGKIKQAQNELEKQIVQSGSRTLGEFLYKEKILKKLPARNKGNEEGLFPTRAMYESEFETIKNHQFKHHNLEEKDWQEIKNIIFYQAPLKPQERGICQFINKFNNLPKWAQEAFEDYKNSSKDKADCKGLPRARLALPSYMRFRILSDVNNLRIVVDETKSLLLTSEQKKKLVQHLSKAKSVNLSAALKQIGFNGVSYRFNCDKGKKNKLIGNQTEVLMNEKLGGKWEALSLPIKDEIIEFLLEAETSEEIYNKAINEWKFDELDAAKLAEIDCGSFVKAVGNLSKELLQELVIEMEENDCASNTALKNLGFDLRQKKNSEIQPELDYYGKVIPASTTSVKYGSQEEVDYGRIANPTIHIALNQLRKLINLLIKQYGNPTEINLEIDQDLKMSYEEKKQFSFQQKKNEEENEKISKELEGLGQENSYGNRLKIKLWKELNLADCNNRKCVFCGSQIGISEIFSSNLEIAHILPFSKTYDDSSANKILVHKSCNGKKKGRAPFEVFGETTFERIKNLPNNKKWRFYEDAMEKLKDENVFEKRQLTDSRYLSKISIQYLSQICPADKIRTANKRMVRLINHHWGLNSILNLNLQRNLDGDKKSPRQKIKDRRYRAVDAMVIGMIDKKFLEQISLDNLNNQSEKLIINYPKEWKKIRDDITDAAEKIVVSYRSDHDANAELHSQTFYGILKKPIPDSDENKSPFNVVFSKKISFLSKNEISRIRDEKIRQTLEDLTKDISSEKKDEKKLAMALQEFSQKNGIKNVRLLDKISTIVKVSSGAGVSPDGKNHISLWMLPSKEIVTDVVSNLRAVKNDKEKLKPHPAAKLLIRLYKGDMIRFNKNGKTVTAKVSSIAENTQCAYVEHNFLAENKEAIGRISLNKNAIVKKNFRKIFVSPDGKVFDPKLIRI